MKNQKNKLARSVANSLTRKNGSKLGRPHQTCYEKLISQAEKDKIAQEDALEQFLFKNSIENLSAEQADDKREKNSEEKYLAKNLHQLELQEKQQNNFCSELLMNNKKNLRAYLCKKEKQNEIGDDVKFSPGKQTNPLALIFERKDFASKNSFNKLSQYEKDNHMKITSEAELKQLADKRRKTNFGRKKNTVIENLDAMVKKSENKIPQLKENIKSFACENKLGRKRHGKKQLQEEYSDINISAASDRVLKQVQLV